VFEARSFASGVRPWTATASRRRYRQIDRDLMPSTIMTFLDLDPEDWRSRSLSGSVGIIVRRQWFARSLGSGIR
jgi:hypothetical protein